MDQIGVVGLSYRHAGAEEIAGFTLPKDDVPQSLGALRAMLGTAELVYLATCNRVEVVFAMPDGHSAHDLRAEVFRGLTGRMPGPGEARAALRTWIGEAAVEHLFLTACGLDSAQAGEREIAAQLRLALEASREAGVCGPMLDRIVGEALSLSGRLQKMAAEARPPSLADLAADRIQHHLASVGSGRSPIDPASPVASGGRGFPANFPGAAGVASKNAGANASAPTDAASGTAPRAAVANVVAILGVSPMTRRASELLHKAGVPLLIVNRTLENAEELARTLNAEAVSLETFRTNPRDVAGLVVATGGNEPVLNEDAIRRLATACKRPPLVIDFGLPPNVDPIACQAAGLPRIGMDEMIQAAQDRRLAQLLRLAPMRAAIDERLGRLREQLASRAIGPQLARLRSSFESIATAEADRALAEELHDLDPHQQEQVRRVIETLAHRLAHLPLAGIRAAAAHANSEETLEAFFSAARLQRPTRAVSSSSAPRSGGPRNAPSSASPSGRPSAVPPPGESSGRKNELAQRYGASTPAPGGRENVAPALAHAGTVAPPGKPPSTLNSAPKAHTSVSTEKRSR